MPCHCRLTPLFVVVLVVQSLVAVLPHTHATMVDGQIIHGPSPIDAPHRCLACSTHAPVVGPAAELVSSFAVTDATADSIERETTVALSVFASGSPRGPPWAV